jgi:hypothetical protein
MSIIRYSTNTKSKTLNLLGAAVVFVSMLSTTSSPALAQIELQESSGGDNREASIEGTWLVTVDRVNDRVKFTAFQSFTAGGVALATGSIDRTPPPAISPIYGSWARKARNSVDVTIYFFVFDLTGKALFLIKNNETFRLSGANNLVGSGVAFMCDLKGEHCVSVGSPIQITGKRVVPEGVPE